MSEPDAAGKGLTDQAGRTAAPKPAWVPSGDRARYAALEGLTDQAGRTAAPKPAWVPSGAEPAHIQSGGLDAAGEGLAREGERGLQDRARYAALEGLTDQAGRTAAPKPAWVPSGAEPAHIQSGGLDAAGEGLAREGGRGLQDRARYAALEGLTITNHGLRHAGGIERYALTLVGGLHALGLRPHFIAKTFDRTLPEYGWVRPLPAGVRWAPGKLRDLAFDWRIGRLKRRQRLGPLIACNQTRWADIAICGSTHPGYLVAQGRDPASAGGSDRLKIGLEREHLRRARVVVAHSQRMADEAVQHYGLDPAKVRLLYPPVDGLQFQPVDDGTRRALRARLGWPEDRAVFVLASTGHARKGLGLLADWFARTELPVTLAVAGRPVDPPSRNLVALGYRTDMPDVYRAADATLMASVYEPFGLVGVESVLCGTPVLVARGIGCAEVLPPPAGLPWSLDDPASLDAAVRQLLDRRRAGTARLAAPRDGLGYDPDVASHVRALLDLAAACGSSRPSGL